MPRNREDGRNLARSWGSWMCVLLLAAIVRPTPLGAEPPAEARSAEEQARRARVSESFERAAFLRAQVPGSEGPGGGESRDRSLREALRLYESILEVDPLPRVYFEMGQVYEELEGPQGGGAEKAELAYREAVRRGGRDQPFFQLEYAHFLSRRGDDDRAAAFYERASLAQPKAEEAHQILLGRYREMWAAGKPQPLTLYLWRLFQAGQVVRVRSIALDLLEAREGAGEEALDRGWQEELLSLVVASLGRRGLSAGELRASEAYDRLAALDRHPHLRQGISEIVHLTAAVERIEKAASEGRLSKEERNDAWEEPEDDAEAGSRSAQGVDFLWWGRLSRGLWRGDGSPDERLPPDISFRRLVRAMGHWYRQHDAPQVAEACFLEAARLGKVGGEVDPASFRDLVELKFAEGDVKGLEEMVKRYEAPLFQQRGRAYRLNELNEIYEYHRTLAELYIAIERLSGRPRDIPERSARSTVYQLQHAIDVGRRLDEQGRAGNLGAVTVDDPLLAPADAGVPSRVQPALVENLARIYRRQSNGDKADEVLLTNAVHYQRVSDFEARDRMVEEVELGNLSTRNLRRWEVLDQERPVVEATPDELRYNLDASGRRVEVSLDENVLRDQADTEELSDRLREKIERGEVAAEVGREGTVEVDVDGRTLELPYRVEKLPKATGPPPR